jgi:iron(III) transport system permease protein
MRRIELRLTKWAVAAGLAALVLSALLLFEPRVAGLWRNTALLAIGAGAIALPVGTFLALLLVKTDAPLRRPAALVLCAMLLVPLALVSGAWEAGFGLQGWQTLSTSSDAARQPWLAGWRAAIWVHGLAAVPWVALIVSAGLRAVEAELEEDAALCCSPWRVLWHVSLRRAAPAIVVAGLWIAIVVSAEISVTDFFQVRTFAEEVYTQAALGAFDPGGMEGAGNSGPETANGAPAVQSLPSRGPVPLPAAPSPAGLWLGLVLTALLALAALASGRQVLGELADPSPRRPWVWRIGRGRWFASAGMWLVMLFLVGVPLGNLLYKAGVQVSLVEGSRVRSWSRAALMERLGDVPKERKADLRLTLAIGSAAASGAFAVGLPLAWSLRRARRAPLVRLAMLAICLTIPGPLLGVALIRLLNPPLGSPLAFLAPLYDTYFPPWLVQTVRALPLVTLILWAALASVPRSLIDAAALDGAGWWGSLLRIALPLRWPAAIAAWLVGLAIAWGELSASVLVMPPSRATLITVWIFRELHYGVDDRVSAAALVSAAGVACLSALAAFFLSLRRGRLSGE